MKPLQTQLNKPGAILSAMLAEGEGRPRAPRAGTVTMSVATRCNHTQPPVVRITNDATGDSDTLFTGRLSCAAVVCAFTGDVLAITGHADDETSKADARLMAQAIAMQHRLKMVLHLLRDPEATKDEAEGEARAIEATLAAIERGW